MGVKRSKEKRRTKGMKPYERDASRARKANKITKGRRMRGKSADKGMTPETLDCKAAVRTPHVLRMPCAPIHRRPP